MRNRWEYSETRRTQPVKSDFSAWNVCSLNTVLFSQTFQTVTPNGVRAHLDSNSLTQRYSYCTVAFSLTDFFFHSMLLTVKWGFEDWYMCFWKHTKIYYKKNNLRQPVLATSPASPPHLFSLIVVLLWQIVAPHRSQLVNMCFPMRSGEEAHRSLWHNNPVVCDTLFSRLLAWACWRLQSRLSLTFSLCVWYNPISKSVESKNS